MNDAEVRSAVRRFHAHNPLTDQELDRLVALHETLMYHLGMFGALHQSTIRSLHTDLKTLEHQKYLRDTSSEQVPYLISA